METINKCCLCHHGVASTAWICDFCNAPTLPTSHHDSLLGDTKQAWSLRILEPERSKYPILRIIGHGNDKIVGSAYVYRSPRVSYVIVIPLDEDWGPKVAAAVQKPGDLEATLLNPKFCAIILYLFGEASTAGCSHSEKKEVDG